MAGKAGSLLIDISADIAALKQDFSEASGVVQGFGRTVQIAARLWAAAFAAMTAKEVLGFVKDLAKAVGDLGDQAKQVGLSARDFQAFVIAMQGAGASAAETSNILASANRFLGAAAEGQKKNIETLNRLGVFMLDAKGNARDYATVLQELAQAILKIRDPMAQAALAQQVFGRSAKEVLPALAEMARGADALAAQAGRKIIDDETIERLNSFDQALKDVSRTLLADFARAMANFGGSAEGGGGGFAKALDFILKTVKEISAEFSAMAQTRVGEVLAQAFGLAMVPVTAFLASIREVLKLINEIPAAVEGAWGWMKGLAAEAQAAGRSAGEWLKQPLVPSAPGSGTAEVAQQQEQARRDQALRQQLATIEEETRRRQEALDNALRRARVGPTPSGLGAGEMPPPAAGRRQPDIVERRRGGAQVDRFAQALEGLRTEQEGIDAGIRKLGESTGKATKEAERLAQLQVDIAQRTAQALKAARVQPDSAQGRALAVEAEALERAKFAYKDLQDVARIALEVNTKFGDGAKELADRVFYLDKALRAGKISAEEYTAALADANEQQANQRDRMDAMKGGVDALAAGWSTAMREATGWQSQFQMGQQLFTQSMSIMTNAITTFVKTGEFDFAALATSFADMLAQMAMQWAAASFMREMASMMGGGGQTADSLMGLVPVGGGGGGMLSSLFSWMGGFFQHGGDVQAGRTITVGEAGPERFVPKVPGTIVPAQGDSGDVTVNVDMGTTAGAADPATALAFGRKVKAAVMDVISTEKRPGGSLYQRMA